MLLQEEGRPSLLRPTPAAIPSAKVIGGAAGYGPGSGEDSQASA